MEHMQAALTSFTRSGCSLCTLWDRMHTAGVASLHKSNIACGHGTYKHSNKACTHIICCHTDGDIYGSEGQYIRYEEGTWDSPEAYEEVSSGHPYVNPRGRSGSARPSRSYGADRFSNDNMADGDDAYVTPETTAPLQAAGQVSTPSGAPLPPAPPPLPPPLGPLLSRHCKRQAR